MERTVDLVVPGARLRDLWALTRPGVLTLVVLTAPPALAPWPGVGAGLAAMAGTIAVAGGCSAFNAVIERHSDARMARTRGRPLPDGRVTVGEGLAFAVAISAAGLGLLGLVGGWLPVALGVAALLHYVLVYTVWLKPRTPQNIVIGGVAGAMGPPIVDAAAHGTVGAVSIGLFLLICAWTPVHFWAIALYRKSDYARAGFPMMPIVVGDQPTRWRMLGYALLTVALSAWVAAGTLMALAVALAAGAWLVGAVIVAMRRQRASADRRVFAVSNAYLAVVCLVLAVATLAP